MQSNEVKYWVAMKVPWSFAKQAEYWQLVRELRKQQSAEMFVVLCCVIQSKHDNIADVAAKYLVQNFSDIARLYPDVAGEVVYSLENHANVNFPREKLKEWAGRCEEVFKQLKPQLMKIDKRVYRKRISCSGKFVYEVMTAGEYEAFGLRDLGEDVKCFAYDVEKKWIIDRDNKALLVCFEEYLVGGRGVKGYQFFWKGEKIVFYAKQLSLALDDRQDGNPFGYDHQIFRFDVPSSVAWMKNTLKRLMKEALCVYEYRNYDPDAKRRSPYH